MATNIIKTFADQFNANSGLLDQLAELRVACLHKAQHYSSVDNSNLSKQFYEAVQKAEAAEDALRDALAAEHKIRTDMGMIA